MDETMDSPSEATTPNHAGHLPDEIILSILSFIPAGLPSTQLTLWSTCLINKSWYHVAVAQLYSAPHITGKNFAAFVRTVCPSINAHVRRSDLAELVHKLDLSRLVHHSTKSLTARLLGRTKRRMEVFRAPAASFGLNCFAALGKCERLRTLDLSLVNDAISMHSLALALRGLDRLEALAFPRSSMREEGFDAAEFVFPASLRTLHVSGGVTNDFLLQLVGPLCEALKVPCLSLAISHCPNLVARRILTVLEGLKDILIGLHVSSVPRVMAGELDWILFLPYLEELSISSSYVFAQSMFLVPAIWDDTLPVGSASDGVWQASLQETAQRSFIPLTPTSTVIKSLEITSGDRPVQRAEAMVGPWMLLMLMKYGNLKHLRHIAISDSCGWTDTTTLAHHTQALVDYLDELSEGEEYVRMTDGKKEIGLFFFDP